MGTPQNLMETVYKAASEGKWHLMKTAYGGTYDKYMVSPITVLKDTAFHLAVYSKKDEPLKSLLSIVNEISIPENPCTLKNAYGNTVLHEAVFAGNMEAVKHLLLGEYDPSMQLHTKNELGETPLYRAASCGKKEIVEYLAKKMGLFSERKLSEDHRKRKDSKPILHAAIEGQHFETALTLLKRDPSLDDMTDEQGRTCLHLLAEMPSAFKSGCAMPKYSIRNLIYCCLSASNGDDDQRKCNKGWQVGRIQKEKDKHESALKLAQELVENNKRHWWQSINVVGPNKVNIETPGQGGRGQGVDPIPLFIATSNGIEEIAKEILEKFPQGVELVNETGQNIMHVAVMHRQREIYRYVKKKFKPIMVRLSSRTDNNGYTLLHHVAHMKHYRGGTMPSPALKLQEEIQWFKRVQRAVPPSLSEQRAPREVPPDNEYKVTAQKFLQMEPEDNLRVVVPPDNENKLTAHKFLQMEPEDHLRVVVSPYKAMQRDKDCKLTALELFQEEHKAQLKLAQEWIEKTSQSCSAVAVLLATVVFAAAYTIPGGSDERGFPIFLHNRFFLAFTILDVIALASSLTSVVMFLSILTSPFEYENFYHNIPRKLILGFTLLFFSVMTTMLAFACTLFLIIHFRKKWTTGLISFAAFFPVTVFALMQFPLYVSFMSTMKDLFKEAGKYLPRYCCPFRCQCCRKRRRIFCLAY
ncbi:ankyrin repeat-containing protein ITN1-like [Populus nigra]|uniref:ankyrin repeat-containing protein ITN1-like n=1 Tax=Populus nigra TaxID=3691 RepID=UPI002B26E98A|nr:ankyrin repeat-containing protein ITN1-like [Populus nigra]XP_061952556.1 ankyrin repeat-containing protein ITN1-like [Populus nigra]XP_061952557.1 ankyrin repeat-containing protein ITN1-like [Populus nigra]